MPEWENNNETDRTKLFRHVCWRVAVFASLHGNRDRGGALRRQNFAASHLIASSSLLPRTAQAQASLCRFVLPNGLLAPRHDSNSGIYVFYIRSNCASVRKSSLGLKLGNHLLRILSPRLIRAG
jgi:hypothetical protein